MEIYRKSVQKSGTKEYPATKGPSLEWILQSRPNWYIYSLQACLLFPLQIFFAHFLANILSYHAKKVEIMQFSITQFYASEKNVRVILGHPVERQKDDVCFCSFQYSMTQMWTRHISLTRISTVRSIL